MSEAPDTVAHFTIYGEPVPWARARRNGNQHYITPKVRGYQSTVAIQGKIAMQGREPMAGPLVVGLEVDISIPKSWTKTAQKQALAGIVRPASKPDFDNLAKCIGDALNGIVWIDDAQIVSAQVDLWYSHEPHLTVFARPWTGTRNQTIKPRGA